MTTKVFYFKLQSGFFKTFLVVVFLSVVKKSVDPWSEKKKHFD